MRSFLLVFFIFIVLKGAKAQKAEEVVQQFLDSQGWAKHIGLNTNYKLTRLYKVGSGGTDYTEEICISEGKYHKKKSILDRDFYYVLSGNQGFIKIPTGSRDKASNFSIKDFSEKEKNDYAQDLMDGIYAFIDFGKKGYTSVLSSEIINNQDCHKLILEKGQIKKSYFFAKSNHQLVRESYLQSGITYTITHQNYELNDLGMNLPVQSIYINSKDNKSIKIIATWSFDKVLEGLNFTK